MGSSEGRDPGQLGQQGPVQLLPPLAVWGWLAQAQGGRLLGLLGAPLVVPGTTVTMQGNVQGKGSSPLRSSLGKPGQG